MMTYQKIYAKLALLNSKELQQELDNYLDYLLDKQAQKQQTLSEKPQFGCAKGKFKMSEDFNVSLDDFKDYMPS